MWLKYLCDVRHHINYVRRRINYVRPRINYVRIRIGSSCNQVAGCGSLAQRLNNACFY